MLRSSVRARVATRAHRGGGAGALVPGNGRKHRRKDVTLCVPPRARSRTMRAMHAHAAAPPRAHACHAHPGVPQVVDWLRLVRTRGHKHECLIVTHNTQSSGALEAASARRSAARQAHASMKLLARRRRRTAPGLSGEACRRAAHRYSSSPPQTCSRAPRHLRNRPPVEAHAVQAAPSQSAAHLHSKHTRRRYPCITARCARDISTGEPCRRISSAFATTITSATPG